MFLCVSPNPAIDKRITLEALVPGMIHRARTAQSFAGGKSTHVAMVLKALGAKPHWVGMCGGATGEQLKAELQSLDIVVHAVPVKCDTRMNFEIIDDSSGVTEIRESGDSVSLDEVGTFENECKQLFKEGAESTVAIFSGSLPPGAPSDLYARLIVAARDAGCRTLLDTSGEALRAALSARPDFVKPNRDEAAEALGIVIDEDHVREAVRKLIAAGPHSVALSLGSSGLMYAADESSPMLFAHAVKVCARSTVGCGDAALAGFAHSLSSGANPTEALRKATACAAANCVADSPGAVRAEMVEKFEEQVRIETFLGAP